MTEMLQLIAALTINEFIHNLFELWGIDQKIDWLHKTIKSKPHGSWPINIDNKYKTTILHGILLIATTGLAYFVLGLMQLDEPQLATVAIAVLLINYIFVVWRTDKIHGHIGLLLRTTRK